MTAIEIPPGLQFEPISHTYFYDGVRVPSVTSVIRPLEGYYRMSEKSLKPYAERGTAVHAETERWDMSEDADPADCPGDLRGYLSAWVNFRTDFGFVPTHIEHRVYHPRLGYSGTIDRVGTVRGAYSVVDIKTSAKLGPAVGCQLAGYQHAWNAEKEEQITGRFAVQLADDGTYRVMEYSNPLDWDAFRGCLALHKWQEGHNFVIGDVRPRIDNGQEDVSAWPQLVQTGTNRLVPSHRAPSLTKETK